MVQTPRPCVAATITVQLVPPVVVSNTWPTPGSSAPIIHLRE
jgi:hypothetical protein